jgi:hypothetical protein
MAVPKHVIECSVLVTLLLSCDVHADVYKCTDADGSLTYSQVPCAVPEKTEKIAVTQTHNETATAECEYAVKFALSAAGAMKNGAGSDELFDLYGGLDSVTKGTIGIINYVYEFRPNVAVTEERIAELTQAKCEAGSLGDVACAALPLMFTKRLGGCDAETAEPPAIPVQSENVLAAVADAQQGDDAAHRLNEREAMNRANESSRQCKEKYQDAIKRLDEQMRSGYTSAQGEVFRERRRGLRENLSQCQQ